MYIITRVCGVVRTPGMEENASAERRQASEPNKCDFAKGVVAKCCSQHAKLQSTLLHVTSTIIMQANSPYCVHLSNPLGAVVGRVYVVDGDDIGYRQKCCEKL